MNYLTKYKSHYDEMLNDLMMNNMKSARKDDRYVIFSYDNTIKPSKSKKTPFCDMPKIIRGN